MKKASTTLMLINLFIISGLFLLSSSVFDQETYNVSSSLPDSINKIVTGSCMPCHSSSGGLMSRSKLNFTEWAQYSLAKQKGKAEKMYSMLIKDAMPPKSARETHPEIIPTPYQINTIKNWAESLNPIQKQ